MYVCVKWSSQLCYTNDSKHLNFLLPLHQLQKKLPKAVSRKAQKFPEELSIYNLFYYLNVFLITGI